MNRIVLIGNGFDLAHDLKTGYKDFIEWYWEQRVLSFIDNRTMLSSDPLFTIRSLTNTFNQIAYSESVDDLNRTERINLLVKIETDTREYKVSYSDFYRGIKDSIEQKGWVDIEYEYYKQLKKYCLSPYQSIHFDKDVPKELKSLNDQLYYLKIKLIEYLSKTCNDISRMNCEIKNLLYEPLTPRDIAVEGITTMSDMLKDVLSNDAQIEYGVDHNYKRFGYITPNSDDLKYYRKLYLKRKFFSSDKPCPFLFPETVLLLNFNYTNTVDKYREEGVAQIINIHGTLNNPNSIIFGYGDELDENYKEIKELEYEESRSNIKSIKYLESDNYRKVLSFIESAPYQIYIMGHSCGNSDRTLINTLFEHKNCISIKPFYNQKTDGTDNFFELAQNINRNFINMKYIRDRVVNKTYCMPLPQNVTLQQDEDKTDN